MIALSIKQPWAELLVAGHKTIEIRTRWPRRPNLPLPVLVAIHAGKTWDDAAPKFVSHPGDAYLYARQSYHRRGGIIGVARFLGRIHFSTREMGPAEAERARAWWESLADQHLNPLESWTDNLVGLRFDNPVRFPHVIPCRGGGSGRLGFFGLAEDVAELVVTAMSGGRSNGSSSEVQAYLI